MPKKGPLYPHVPKSKQASPAGETQITVTTTVVVSDQRIQDLLVTAFEGGSNDWYVIKSFNYPKGQTKESLGIEFPHAELPLKEGGSLTIGDLSNKKVNKILDRAAIVRGLKLMAEKQPRHWTDFMDENDDAITADVFLQLAVFGEVIYG